MLSLRLASALTVLSTACTLAVAAPTNVAGNATSLVSLGSFAAGTYNITATGLISLVGDGSMPIRPDGTPDIVNNNPAWTSFYPNGTFSFAGQYGAAGTGAKIGALIGTLNPLASPLQSLSTPVANPDWFLIGYGTTITLASAGSIYAGINDTYLSNNSGAYQVNVTAVPEPAQWVLALVGLAALGLKARRRAG